jgi:hypothetical protein
MKPPPRHAVFLNKVEDLVIATRRYRAKTGVICVPVILYWIVAGACAPPALATNVGGIINSSATWTVAGSPYNITSKVQVASGVALSIQPGVVVTNGILDGTIEIFGELVAVGNSTDAVSTRFRS